MRLILVRHGESEGNRLGLSQGHYDFDLTEKGVIESRRAGDRLKGEKIDIV